MGEGGVGEGDMDYAEREKGGGEGEGEGKDVWVSDVGGWGGNYMRIQ